jgi:hypothetical protein
MQSVAAGFSGKLLAVEAGLAVKEAVVPKSSFYTIANHIR